MKKICQYCGKEYNAKRSSSKYCSRDCQIKARTKKVTVKCDYCGKEIEKKPCHMSAKHHFCNKECQGKWKSIHNTGENHPTYSRVKTKCATCGKEIEVQKHRYENNKYVYCSKECQHQGLVGRECSIEMRKKISKAVPKGSDSPLWKPEKTDEERLIGRATPENNAWRNEVMIRDNYTCQCCGKRGGDLAAHHLNGYHWDTEHRYDINNGVTLCKNCHKKFHSEYGLKNNTKEQYENFIRDNNKSAS